MRDLDVHCPTCTCDTPTSSIGDPTAPMFALVLDVERAWSALMAEDRAAGRSKWRPFHTKAAA